MTGELQSKIQKWLETHGASVELKTAREFQCAGFSITQGCHFLDQCTGKIRESDLLAQIHKNSGGCPSVTICVDFLVECKQSKHPWVAFTVRDHELHDDSHLAPFSWIMDDLARSQIAHRVSENWLSIPKIYDDNHPTAYSIKQAFLGEKAKAQEIPFSAAAQLLDAVESRMEKIAKHLPQNSRHLLFPVIVFDGELFECCLTESGEKLESRDEITLLLRDRQLSVTGTRKVEGFARVKIVTLKSLPNFVVRAKEMSSWICDLASKIK